MQRRALFTKILKPVTAVGEQPRFITPPYFSGEFDCEGCDAPCVSVCARELLSFDGQRVIFDVKDRGCNFCKECAIACESVKKSVLDLKFSQNIGAKTAIQVNSCLAWNDVICYNCQDACKYKAIDFLGVFRPMINERCNSCGECINACFKHSIKMESL
ncbi:MULTISPECIES: 4Fe-4S dicluster domain-containing protein [Campylobacter]|uniref:4Fe-4S ferredoxin n=1 Tax=Campylobacter TaxID=194 RepID=UPI0014732AF7|nr:MULTISPECIES: 4Fe-4S ferredoxin [unclassified Campylobacter]MBE3022428.1 4Fe-4S ferredoxin [Campylobacter sp. 7477a]MBE3610083.1 4Fe-4S ferredoxin [Campylobacter sp. RM12916]